MASLVQDGRRSVEIKAERGSNWVHAVKSVYETGDVIVCFTEQYTGLLHRALSQVLESNLKATVYILSGLTPPKFKSNRVMEASTWLGLIGIIVGFGLLQANIIQLQEGWFQSLLLILSTFCEFWLIGVWNGRAG